MSYTSQIKTKILDPEYFNSTQGCEFRLNDLNVTYLSSMYVGNIGAYGTNGDRAIIKYNPYGGTKKLVKNITLYNGGDVLAQLLDAGSWIAFKAQNQDNSDKLSKTNKTLGRNALLNANQHAVNTPARISNIVHPITDGVGATEALTGKGYFDVRDLLKELKQMRSFDTSIFKNLRLVIDWELDPLKFANRASGTADGTNPLSAIQATRPILVVDCVNDPEIRKQLMLNMRQVAYTSIESDRIVIPAVGPAVVGQRSSSVLKGFDNKIVNRMLLVNNPTSLTSGVVAMSDNAGTFHPDSQLLYAGKDNSIAQHRLEVQLAVNGANLFNGNGLGGDSVRQAVMTDTWGDVIANWGSSRVGVCNKVAGLIATLTHDYYSTPDVVMFGGDYTGFKVMDRVKYLELSYTRSGVAVANRLVFNAGASNQALNVIVYAEIPKMLMVGNGGYRVAYM